MGEQMTVKFETLLNGYTAARARFEEARLGQDGGATFHPLFEALNWAVVMDDHVRMHWRPEGERLDFNWRDRIELEGRTIVKGIRFARNRVHHQWADAMQLDDGGFQFPAQLPLVFHEWAWISVEKMPPGPDNHGFDDYRSSLHGAPVRLSLSALGQVYRAMASEQLN